MIKNNKQHDLFFTIPNDITRNSIESILGTNDKFLISYILIEKYHSIEGYSWLSIKELMEFYGYKFLSNKPKAFYDMVDTIRFMADSGYIEVYGDLTKIKYSSVLKVKIIPDVFYQGNGFCMLSSDQFDVIANAPKELNREALLRIFLYILSYIGKRSTSKQSNDMDSFFKYPEAFYGSISEMVNQLGISKTTATACLNYLVDGSDDVKPLLKKYITGSYKYKKDKPPRNAPNIYVLNKDGFANEIDMALNILKRRYKVDHFYPPCGSYTSDDDNGSDSTGSDNNVTDVEAIEMDDNWGDEWNDEDDGWDS